MISSAATAASSPGTTKPGRPVLSATNMTAASGTRYPAPRKAATPMTRKRLVSTSPTIPPTARPRSAPVGSGTQSYARRRRRASRGAPRPRGRRTRTQDCRAPPGSVPCRSSRRSSNSSWLMRPAPGAACGAPDRPGRGLRARTPRRLAGALKIADARCRAGHQQHPTVGCAEPWSEALLEEGADRRAEIERWPFEAHATPKPSVVNAASILPGTSCRRIGWSASWKDCR